jgi:hypothetical protein
MKNAMYMYKLVILKEMHYNLGQLRVVSWKLAFRFGAYTAKMQSDNGIKTQNVGEWLALEMNISYNMHAVQEHVYEIRYQKSRPGVEPAREQRC